MMAFGSTSSSSRPRSGATDSLGMAAQPDSRLMHADNANDRATARATAVRFVVVIVFERGKPQFRGDDAPLFLKIVTFMMGQADATRVEVDVQHLARPGGCHQV